MSDPVRLDDAVLRERAYRWCGANQMTYSEWTVDELTKAFIALHDAARAEQREADAQYVNDNAKDVVDGFRLARAIRAQKDTP